MLSGIYSGLCGDFNGKTEDDFRRLDNAMADNALQFGKSWADSSSACELTVKDTCQQNPDREAWAQKGMLLYLLVLHNKLWYDFLVSSECSTSTKVKKLILF